MTEEIDVKATEPSPEESEEALDTAIEEANAEAETEETDVKPDPEPSEDQPEEKDEPKVEPDLQERLKKLEEEKENLKKALQQERTIKRANQPSLAPVAPAQNAKLDSDAYVKSLVTAAEEGAKAELYKEFPELSPDNDPQNVAYNEFAKNFAVWCQVHGVVPATKEQFLEGGRSVMGLKTGRATGVEQAKKEARAEANREHLKAEAANIGGTSPGVHEKQVEVTDADRRAAKAVGMDIKSYMKNKDVYGDQIPI